MQGWVSISVLESESLASRYRQEFTFLLIPKRHRKYCQTISVARCRLIFVIAITSRSCQEAQHLATCILSRRQPCCKMNTVCRPGNRNYRSIEEGPIQKGSVQKGLMQKGLIQKGLIQKGLIQKGLSQKGLIQKGSNF